MTAKFFEGLLGKLPVKDSQNNIIIMGDYNSRSVVSDKYKYVKKISPDLCNTGNNTVDNYCNIKSALELLSFEFKSDKLYGQLQPGDTQLDLLVGSNTYNKFNTGKRYGKMKEYPITFLPTYKRQTQKQFTKQSHKQISKKQSSAKNTLKSIKLPGQFSLEKGSNSSKTFRLPGYADRITVIGANIGLLPTKNMYTSIPVFGNDHIPVVATFEVQSYIASYQPH